MCFNLRRRACMCYTYAWNQVVVLWGIILIGTCMSSSVGQKSCVNLCIYMFKIWISKKTYKNCWRRRVVWLWFYVGLFVACFLSCRLGAMNIWTWRVYVLVSWWVKRNVLLNGLRRVDCGVVLVSRVSRAMISCGFRIACCLVIVGVMCVMFAWFKRLMIRSYYLLELVRVNWCLIYLKHV